MPFSEISELLMLFTSEISALDDTLSQSLLMLFLSEISELYHAFPLKLQSFFMCFSEIPELFILFL